MGCGGVCGGIVGGRVCIVWYAFLAIKMRVYLILVSFLLFGRQNCESNYKMILTKISR